MVRKGILYMDFNLKDRVVLITGATGGIGQALTRAFAQEGCRLAISSTSQAKLDAFTPSLGLGEDRLKTFVTDVTDEGQVQAFVDGAARYFGGIDVLVITAGYEGKVEKIQDASLETYKKVYDINLFGPLYCMKYAAPHMIAKQHGAIVTIASNGSYTGSPGMGAYCSSKHAVAGLMKCAALELGPEGIHCNYICPGAVEPPMIHRIEEGTTGNSTGDLFADQYLDKRYCRPDEVAALALYLASDISSHIMGSGIRIDGGLDALC